MTSNNLSIILDKLKCADKLALLIRYLYKNPYTEADMIFITKQITKLEHYFKTFRKGTEKVPTEPAESVEIVHLSKFSKFKGDDPAPPGW